MGKFHSPALTGFEVISHWVPYLMFSVYFGSLADRYDCRRIIQAGQVLFMLVSAGWGVLFVTHSLHLWEACLLLVLHGCAGCIWGPGEQLMLHDFVGQEELPSAVRLNATFRSIGILFGPVVGAVLLLGLGPVAGIFTNIVFYLPLTLFLFRTKFTGQIRDHGVPRTRVGVVDSLRVLRDVRSNHVLVSMLLLAGLSSFFIGASLQTSMPIFAQDLGAGSAGIAYSVLLFANGAGGVIGGFLLEATDRIRPTVTATVVSTAIFGITTVFFAFTGNLLFAIALLVVGGVANLASMSIGQTVVQLLAPPADRGRVIGVYGATDAHGWPIEGPIAPSVAHRWGCANPACRIFRLCRAGSGGECGEARGGECGGARRRCGRYQLPWWSGTRAINGRTAMSSTANAMKTRASTSPGWLLRATMAVATETAVMDPAWRNMPRNPAMAAT